MKKNLRHLRNLRDKKYKEHISGTNHWPAAKYPRKSVSNPKSKNVPITPRKSDEETSQIPLSDNRHLSILGYLHDAGWSVRLMLLATGPANIIY